MSFDLSGITKYVEGGFAIGGGLTYVCSQLYQHGVALSSLTPQGALASTVGGYLIAKGAEAAEDNLEHATDKQKLCHRGLTALAGGAALLSGSGILATAATTGAVYFGLSWAAKQFGIVKPPPAPAPAPAPAPTAPAYLGQDFPVGHTNAATFNAQGVQAKSGYDLLLGADTVLAPFQKGEKPVKMAHNAGAKVVAATMQVCMPMIVEYACPRIQELLTENQLFNGATGRDVLEELRNGVNHDGSSWLGHADPANDPTPAVTQANTEAQRYAAHALLRLMRTNQPRTSAELRDIRTHLKTLLQHGIPTEFVGAEQQANMKKLIGLINLHEAAQQKDGVLNLAGSCEAFQMLGLGDQPADMKIDDAVRGLTKCLAGSQAYVAKDKSLSSISIKPPRPYKYVVQLFSGTVQLDVDQIKQAGSTDVELLGLVRQEADRQPVAVVRRPNDRNWFTSVVRAKHLWFRTDNSQAVEARKVEEVGFSKVQSEDASKWVRAAVWLNPTY